MVPSWLFREFRKKHGSLFLNQAVDPARAFQGFSVARMQGFYLNLFLPDDSKQLQSGAP